MYYYEALGDEGFQEFCQALIAASFPNVQCLPVGQPDGGRDAVLLRHLLEQGNSKSRRDQIVYQVKFFKNPTNTREERDIIQDIIKKEKPKIENLKKSGLSKYYLITNMKGTSHLEKGSIDRVNEQLSTSLGIESYCWWRDDLDRRLDGNSSVKWSYPHILKATDLLEALVGGLLGEAEERRRGAIRAYITSQYDDDQELKFKQTDLRSLMTELFVDLPMTFAEDALDIETDRRLRRIQNSYSSNGVYWTPRYFPGGELDSANFFIRDTHDNQLSRIVLEGAPGQGKSTVTQYVCQVMRMHLLSKEADIEALPAEYKGIKIRVPFRVDLRDLAKWIGGIDPFQSKKVELNDNEPRSLEGFLAGQVRFISGGHEFDVSDLTAVAKVSHLFLALDGFDEVADVALREKLVSEITKGTNRLMNAGGYSIQTIVTSRPAAFAKSIRFPRDQWAYFALLPLGRRQVDEYSEKWMKAKGLKEAERLQLSRILDSKLKEAHTQFLAKNPMQLTILLSLIHNRGASLPEKRTAMYDAYMDMFFSRESEKSEIVRDNRELLIDIHRFLAWKLQTAAEGGENGSIEHSSLQSILLLYLYEQGEDTRIVKDLFNGIIERVGALVSRVQETYEFEVQPLREYFAARHLYETAPYSPVGDERQGTKLDRFDALIRNPYWLNVARFYGGCFSKGEISALVDELAELTNDQMYKITSHPRQVALMLLVDWVFTQYQPAVKKVISFVGEFPQFRQVLANAEQEGASGWSVLPDRSGRADFIELLWSRTKSVNRADEMMALATAITQNSPVAERAEKWRQAKDNFPYARWIGMGSMLRLFDKDSLPVLNLQNDEISSEIISALLNNDQFSYLESKGVFEEARHALLNDSVIVNFTGQQRNVDTSRLSGCAAILSYYQYRIALNSAGQGTLRHILEARYNPDRGERSILPLSPALESEEPRVVEAYERFLATNTDITATSTAPWVELVESLRGAWGDCPAIDRIAFIGAGVRAKEAGLDCRLKDSSNLVGAARFARFKSGAPKWWESKLIEEEHADERRRLLLLLWIWGTPKTILKVSETVGSMIASLSDREWTMLCRDYRRLSLVRKRDESFEAAETELAAIKRQGARLCMFAGAGVASRSRLALSLAISDFHFAGSPELQFAMDTVLDSCRSSAAWKAGLPRIAELYSRGASVRERGGRGDMPAAIASQISAQPDKYPLPLVAAADAQLRSLAGAKAPKLLDIAKRDGWFSQGGEAQAAQ